MMKRCLLIGIALVFVWTGCIKDEAELIPDHLEAQRFQPKDSVWAVSIRAEKEVPGQAENEIMTKGLAIAGDSEASTTVLQSIWKADEPVEVYLDGAHIGTLTATPDPTDAHWATLSGSVTTTDITPGTSTLTLLTPRQDWDYTGQVGRLLLLDDPNHPRETNRSIEKKYHYTMAENVLVTAASNGTITTDKASFANQQSIYRLSFRFQHNGAGDKFSITAKRIWITAADGGLVQTRALNGSSVTGTIEVLLDNASENPFFVALRNNNTATAEDLKFKVMDNEGITYYGTKNIPAAYKPNGTFVSMKNATLTGRLELALQNETVTEVL